MPRRSLHILLVALLLVGSVGMATLLHDHDCHAPASERAHCQICLLAAVAAVGLLFAIIRIEIGQAPRFERATVRFFLPARHDRSWSVSSRGPPLS